MVTFKSLEEISLSIIDFLRLVQPDLDTKPGEVARDLIDAPAIEISKLYVELRNNSNLQSFASGIGSDLDKLARNFGIVRNSGSPATGTIFFTTNDLTSDIFIPAGTIVTAQSGLTFSTLVDTSFERTKASLYRSNALRIRSDLDLASITDQYALEVGVEATSFGSGGNVGKLSITKHDAPGVSRVINVSAMTGGTDAETDTAFRARILGIFAGSNVGTSLGYVNSLLADPRINDALPVEPGDTLMTRDGTVVGKNDDGEDIVISSGTGGKVDLYIQGTSLESFTESFIYRDLSGKADPTDSRNDFILGQREVNPNLDFQQRRRLLMRNGTLPFQPVESIVSISGSISGSNFVQRYIDDDGIERGNYQLIKDDGAFGYSPFGFDRIHFISSKIELPSESTSKGVFNGQDSLDFTDVSNISTVRQEIILNNQHAVVDSSDKSILKLAHTPVKSVLRVDNLTTGQRYTIENQNIDGGARNETGRIKISGGTLPASTDILQASFIWDKQYDKNLDFDNLDGDNSFRAVQDAIDWGWANRVKAEEKTVLFSVDDGYHIIVEHPITKVVNVNRIFQEDILNNTGKLVVSDHITSIYSVVDGDGRELFYTKENNGSFSGMEITLPTDTLLNDGELATVKYNAQDIFSPDGYEFGSFNGAVIYLNDDVAEIGETVFVDYIANVPTILPTTSLSDLPAVSFKNEFVVDGLSVGAQPTSREYDGSGNVVRLLRFSPSYLRMSVQGISSVGRLTIKGTSIRKIETVFPITKDGLTIDLQQVIRRELGLSSLPSSMFVSHIAYISKVDVNDNTVDTQFEFDLLNCELANNTYSQRTAVQNSSLSNTQVKIASTAKNTNESLKAGQNIKIAFYIVDTNTIENSTISSSGTHYSKHRYIYLDKISIGSGFTNLSGSIDGTINIQSATQPVSGSTYYVGYSYTAPKEGERIIVNFNYNRLVGDATRRVESVRPVTADILVKAAKPISIDIEIDIIPSASTRQTDETIRQNVQEVLTAFLTSGGLASTLDSSDVINAVYSAGDIDRVEVKTFNLSGNTGKRKTIQAGRNEYMSVGTITINVVKR